MTTDLILPLADPRATLAAAGGKGASLARLAQAGLPVPPGFHVTTAAYQQFVAEASLWPAIAAALAGASPATPATLEAASAAIGRAFAQATMPPAIGAAIAQAYAALGQPAVAVRSSATAEDLPGASFAGQQETFLNVHGPEAVLQAVQRCWASLWTARAIGYRAQHGFDHAAVSLAVVVQALVPAEAAGILFSANPVTGHRGQAVITAAWGLGEAVVGGQVTPDTLTVDKATGKVVKRDIADKQVMTVRTETGSAEQPTPAAQRRAPVLRPAQAAELARLAARIEQLFGQPLDIEWALGGGRLWVLQARPITALPPEPPEWERPDPQATYARGSLAEHTPGPVTPLFATLGLRLANEATDALWQQVLGPKSTALFSPGGFYKPINGYVYGGFRMSGRNMWLVVKLSGKQLGPFMRNSVARWRGARERLAAAVTEWAPRAPASLPPAELLEGARAVFGAACRYFTEIQTTLPAASMSETLFTQFYTRLAQRKGDPEPAAFLLGFDSAATRADQALWDLAEWVKASPLADYARATPAAELADHLGQAQPPAGLPGSAWAEWRARFARHLAEHAQTAYELDFAHPTPAEAPAPLLETLKLYLAGQAPNPHERQRAAAARRELAAQAALGRLGWPRRRWFERLLRWAQETAPMREDSLFDLGLGHGVVRRLLGELGRRLAAGGAIPEAGDIYWLEEAEVEAAAHWLGRGEPLPSYADRIAPRRAAWEAALKLIPPVMLPERSGWQRLIHGGEATQAAGKLVLNGVGTSAGQVTAPACVLLGPEDFDQMRPGAVLVAVTTTPAWTPLFSLAAAVVTDIGGPLSHSSIVAREYGIPAVMAARNATRYIHTGDTVTVDGASGKVTVATRR